MIRCLVLCLTSLFLSACGSVSAEEPGSKRQSGSAAGSGETAVATFAGGCFWCMEPPFDKLDGVISTTSGYTGGQVDNPTYKQVSAGTTGHTEALQVVYDPSKVSYEKLLYVFWRNIDPFDASGQFCDKGSQYRPGIFYHDETQKTAAMASKKALEESGRWKQPFAVEISPLSKFYAAEDYHQDYYEKNPVRYRYYRFGCGRDKRLEAVWGDEAKK